jgi:hypothetical protein
VGDHHHGGLTIADYFTKVVHNQMTVTSVELTGGFVAGILLRAATHHGFTSGKARRSDASGASGPTIQAGDAGRFSLVMPA